MRSVGTKVACCSRWAAVAVVDERFVTYTFKRGLNTNSHCTVGAFDKGCHLFVAI